MSDPEDPSNDPASIADDLRVYATRLIEGQPDAEFDGTAGRSTSRPDWLIEYEIEVMTNLRSIRACVGRSDLRVTFVHDKRREYRKRGGRLKSVKITRTTQTQYVVALVTSHPVLPADFTRAFGNEPAERTKQRADFANARGAAFTCKGGPRFDIGDLLGIVSIIDDDDEVVDLDDLEGGAL